MSAIGGISSSSQVFLREEPFKKRARQNEEGAAIDLWDRSSGSSLVPKVRKDEGGCRFLPNRDAMQRARIPDAYLLQTPKTVYQRALMQATIPYYSSKTLLNRFPSPLQSPGEPRPIWKIPSKPWRMYGGGSDPSSNDFYSRPLDWGSFIYYGVGSCISSVDPLRDSMPEPIVFPGDMSISSIKSSPDLEEIAIGGKEGCLSLFDLQAELVSLSHKVDLIYRGKIFCIGWRGDGAELTMGLNNSIVHFDKRQKCEVWGISLELDQFNCSVDWNRSNVLLATGNSNNALRVFDVRWIKKEDPLYKFKAQSGIKALQWNPKNPDLLAIGAGTLDQHLYLFDLKMMKNICNINAGSQVCDLKWIDGDQGHLVAGLGYGSSSSEKLSVWRYRKEIESIQKIGVMGGFEDYRTLNLVKDPKSANICCHSSHNDGIEQKAVVWELENIEKTKVRESRKERQTLYTQPLSVR